MVILWNVWLGLFFLPFSNLNFGGARSTPVKSLAGFESAQACLLVEGTQPSSQGFNRISFSGAHHRKSFFFMSKNNKQNSKLQRSLLVRAQRNR
jgi:hypothetical protein